MSLNHFADRLNHAIQSKQTVLMVGLDPRAQRLPTDLQVSSSSNYSKTAEAYEVFCKRIIDVVAPLVPCVKPQAAFFEEQGPSGTQALWNVVRYAQAAGLIVIMDAKRGDIGSTAQAYASAYLGDSTDSAWGCDALTVNPYLGDDSLTPFVERCGETGCGIFVLVRTSNPGGKMLQELQTDNQKIYALVGKHVQQLAESTLGNSGFGAVGAVVGATNPAQLAELRQLMPNTIFLVPGFGAQGGTAEGVASAFNEDGLGAIVNSSRGIIFAYEKEEYRDQQNWERAVELAAKDAIDKLSKVSNLHRQT